MYRNCIYCAAPFPLNQAIEAFPVGGTVAFDPTRGRLWAVCGGCARWNLSPLEERWEPVEQAERLFLEGRLRVQRENVGMARLPDGTRLVRIGEAAGRELAAWRYGSELRGRRQQYLAGMAGLAAGGLGLWLFGQALLVGGPALVFLGWDLRRGYLDRRVLQRLEGAGGVGVPLRRGHLGGARMETSGEGALSLVLPQAPGARPGAPLVLAGEPARALLTRAMLLVNRGGAGQREVDVAVAALAERGPESVVDDAASGRRALGLPFTVDGTPRLPFTRAVISELVEGIRTGVGSAFGGGPSSPAHADATRMLTPPDGSLAPAEALMLEMALHEASERRALEGELTVLQAAWREAEEIAALADGLVSAPSLPTTPLPLPPQAVAGKTA